MIQNVRHGGIEFEIRHVPEPRGGENDGIVHGNIYYWKRYIEIDSNNPTSMQLETLLHELAHLLMYKAGNPIDEKEEQIVRLISRGFLDLFLQNSALMDMLHRECCKIRSGESS